MDTKATRFLRSLKDKKIALCGIGKSNFSLLKLLTSYGAKIIACDRREKEKLGEFLDEATKYGVELSLGENYLKDIDADIIFRTPGMKYHMPELEEYRKQGKVVTSEMEVFFQLCPCKIIAVTGSDGKTTTTTIISELLKASGKNVHLGGNIGTPLLPIIEEIKPDDYAVVELSSFQLISMRQACDVAVVTNISPNHLDIHKDMQEYIDSKRNIILHQNAFSKSVLNLNNDITVSFCEDVRGENMVFSIDTAVDNGTYMDKNGNIILSRHGIQTLIMNKDDIKIKGNHNIENYLAAICAVSDIVPADVIKDVAQNFGGVEHRAEFVREVNGVKYYNDSIASSPTRTIQGTLSLYDFKITLIAGGYDKHISYDELGEKICQKVKLLILMGDTADKIENAVKKSPLYSEKDVVIIRVKNMEQAVKTAFENCRSGDIVSLSPASASFDLYKDFNARGKDFKRLVNLL